MKHLPTIILAVITVALFPTKAGGAEYNMDDVNGKITIIKDNRLHMMQTVIDEQNLLQSQEFMNLKTKCTSDWDKIIANFEDVDGGDESKILVIRGFSQLSAQNYMTVIEGLVSKYEDGTVSETLIREVLYPAGRMKAFARDNFNHVRMIAVLNRVKAKSRNTDFKKGLTEILTGASKESLDNFREAHEGMPEGNIPVVLLPE